MIPDLTTYDVILVNSSAGKDSQAMLDFVVELAAASACRNQIVIAHADLGREEWPGTKELAIEHAAHYGLPIEVVRREKRPLLEEVRARGKWPSSTVRFCTSFYKRDPILKLMTRLNRRFGIGARILNCYGFRAEESPRRRKLPQFQANLRATNGRRHVDDWLPIQDWTLRQVWDRIAQAGTRPHPAYAKGMPRLSCRFCIFAPKAALMLSARLNPELFADYVAVEKEIGHSFRKELPLAAVQQAIEAKEDMGPMDGAWNM